jgi:uncharacterized damage-inducible protein DinB
MSENFLVRLFEHNNWANNEILRVCTALTNEQLDASPTSATFGSIRSTLVHFVSSQESYLRTLTLPVDVRRERVIVDYADLQQSLNASGEALLKLARDPSGIYPQTPLQTRDDYHVEPWVLLVQIINHATEHREQIKSMLTALGITPPDIDGWMYGEAVGALAPMTA